MEVSEVVIGVNSSPKRNLMVYISKDYTLEIPFENT